MNDFVKNFAMIFTTVLTTIAFFLTVMRYKPVRNIFLGGWNAFIDEVAINYKIKQDKFTNDIQDLKNKLINHEIEITKLKERIKLQDDNIKLQFSLINERLDKQNILATEQMNLINTLIQMQKEKE